MLTTQKELDIALLLESAIQQASARQNESQKENGHVNVFKVNKQKEFSCFRCTGKYSAKVCPFINKQCFYCENKGHIVKVCQKKTTEKTVRAHSSNIVMATRKLEVEDEVKGSDLLAISRLYHNPAPPIKVNIEVNGFFIPMEVDTDVWNAVRGFITLFSFIKLWYENNTFFAFMKLSFPKLVLSSYT